MFSVTKVIRGNRVRRIQARNRVVGDTNTSVVKATKIAGFGQRAIVGREESA